MSAHTTTRAARPRPIVAIASWEYRSAVRARWVVTMAAVFGVLSLVVTVLAFRNVRELGLTGIGPASASLVNLGVLLPSLMGLLLGAGTLSGAGERGMLSMLCAQPLRRGQVAVGSFLGLAGALGATLGVGFGLALIVVAGAATADDLPALAMLLLSTAGVAAACVAMGVAISSAVAQRVQALALAIGLWIVLALGLDIAIAALAPSLHLGPGGLLAAVLVNPLETGRILALLGTNLDGAALGPFGAYLIGAFGRAGTIGLLVVALLAWTMGPLLVARWALDRRDL